MYGWDVLEYNTINSYNHLFYDNVYLKYMLKWIFFPSGNNSAGGWMPCSNNLKHAH